MENIESIELPESYSPYNKVKKRTIGYDGKEGVRMFDGGESTYILTISLLTFDL